MSYRLNLTSLVLLICVLAIPANVQGQQDSNSPVEGIYLPSNVVDQIKKNDAAKNLTIQSTPTQSANNLQARNTVDGNVELASFDAAVGTPLRRPMDLPPTSMRTLGNNKIAPAAKRIYVAKTPVYIQQMPPVNAEFSAPPKATASRTNINAAYRFSDPNLQAAHSTIVNPNPIQPTSMMPNSLPQHANYSHQPAMAQALPDASSCECQEASCKSCRFKLLRKPELPELFTRIYPTGDMPQRFPYEVESQTYYHRPYNGYKFSNEAQESMINGGARSRPYSHWITEQLNKQRELEFAGLEEDLAEDGYLEYADWKDHEKGRIQWEAKQPPKFPLDARRNSPRAR